MKVRKLLIISLALFPVLSGQTTKDSVSVEKPNEVVRLDRSEIKQNHEMMIVRRKEHQLYKVLSDLNQDLDTIKKSLP